MTLKKRVLLSVLRRKSKSLLLFCLIFILGNVMAGAIAIQEAVNQVEIKIKKQLGAEATIDFDYNNFWADSKKAVNGLEFPADISLETLMKIGESSYVSYYDYNQGKYIDTEKWQEYRQDKRMEAMSGLSEEELPNGFYLMGVNYGSLLDLKEKRIELLSGRTITADEIAKGAPVAVVSKQLAEKNNWSLGERVVLDNVHYEFNEALGEVNNKPSFIQTLPLEIIGFFSPNRTPQKRTANQSPVTSSQTYQEELIFNQLYVPNAVVSAFTLDFFEKWAALNPAEWTEEDIKRESELFNPQYVLKSPEVAAAFKEESQPLLEKYYLLLTAADQYEAIAGNVNGLKKIARLILKIATVATLVILTLVILLFLRDRKQELGIYLALGEKKWRVGTQIILEVLLVAFIAISMAIVSGSFLAKGVSSSLLTINPVETSGESEYYVPDFVGKASISESEVANTYHVKLSSNYICLLYFIGLGTSIGATLIPLIYLLRLNPKVILM